MTEAEPFEAFPGDALTFLLDLRANNERAWFNEHKKTYETAIKQPAQAFCRAMAEALETLTDEPHGHKIFRIHRERPLLQGQDALQHPSAYRLHVGKQVIRGTILVLRPGSRQPHPRHRNLRFRQGRSRDVFASACSERTVLISQS